jgi:hypothetical protein
VVLKVIDASEEQEMVIASVIATVLMLDIRNFRLPATDQDALFAELMRRGWPRTTIENHLDLAFQKLDASLATPKASTLI